jgi:hypothetical protein
LNGVLFPATMMVHRLCLSKIRKVRGNELYFSPSMPASLLALLITLGSILRSRLDLLTSNSRSSLCAIKPLTCAQTTTQTPNVAGYPIRTNTCSGPAPKSPTPAKAVDEIEQTLAASRYMSAMLNVGREPIAFGPHLVAFVEERVKSLQDECHVLFPLRGGSLNFPNSETFRFVPSPPTLS